MSDLAEFLLARIGEDEVTAQAAMEQSFEGGEADWCASWLHTGIRHLVRNVDFDCMDHPDDLHECGRPARYAGAHIARWDPARVLAGCQGKRGIVENAGAHHPGERGYGAAQYAVRCLALEYADHPDFLEEWKP